MPRRCCLVLLLVFGMSVGCGQSTPEPTPEDANLPGKGGDRAKSSNRDAAARPAKRAAPVLGKVVFLVRPVSWSNRDILKVEVEGDPKDKKHLNGYQIKNLQALEGPLPAAGVYYLRQNTIHYSRGKGKPVEMEVSTDSEYGPFFDQKLPSGVRLIDVVWLGKCKADVEGPDSTEGFKNRPFNYYQANYEKK